MSNNETTTGFKGGLQPCLTLVPPTKKDVDETEIIEFSLKLRAGSGANAPTYKRKVARFNGGSPAEWIEVLEALDEIFTRNGLTTPHDQENIVRTILRGDAWTAFESSLQEQKENAENPAEPLPLTQDDQPGQPGLERLQRQSFEHRHRPAQRPAPLGVVVLEVIGRGQAPRASDLSVRTGHRTRVDLAHAESPGSRRSPIGSVPGGCADSRRSAVTEVTFGGPTSPNTSTSIDARPRRAIWKACWVKALGGSNPPSSAHEGPVTCSDVGGGPFRVADTGELGLAGC